MLKIFLAGVLLAGLAWGQEAPKTASVAVENKILKAENALGKAELVETQAQAQFEQLKQAYAQATAQQKQAEKDVADATEEAWKESGLSKADYDFDPANFTFVKKAKTAEKK